MKQLKIMSATVGLAASLSFATPVWADVIQTFNFAYSGAQFGNMATATGFITLDLTLLGDPFNSQASLPSPIVTGLSMTVSGASQGNGTFGIGSFSSVDLDSDGFALDFTKDLYGQAEDAYGDIWGTYNYGYDNYTGNFSLTASNGLAPTGSGPFRLDTADGSGSLMALTSFAPAAAVPEPSSLFLLGFGVLGYGFLARKVRRAA